MPKFKQGADSEWVDTVLKKGTIADKLAAHTLLVHESKNWSSLSALIDMIDPKKCRRRCVMAMATLKELFLDTLNLCGKNCQIKEEDEKQKVRFYYVRFVDHLNRVAFDNLEETRHKAIWTLSELLYKYQDNKDYILDKLVNKLGDKIPKLASTAGHFVEKAVNSEKEEVRMRTIKYVQIFLARPNQTNRARFYATSLLSRIKMIRGNFEMANELMKTYLGLYTTLMQEKNFDSKMMSAILTGIHRAYPYSKLENEVFEQHLQTLYTLVHQVNFRMRVVAMTLIKNIVYKRAELTKSPVEDRFYNLIFGQLIQPEIHTTSRQEAFVGLVLTVINDDTVLERKEAFIKRILQVALNSQPEFAQLLLTTITKIKGINTDLCMSSKDNQEEMDADEDDDESSDEEEDNESNNPTDAMNVGSSWNHRRTSKSNKGCDLLARNPLAAKPEQLNELYLLRQCFDPNIAAVAKKLMRE